MSTNEILELGNREEHSAVKIIDAKVFQLAFRRFLWLKVKFNGFCDDLACFSLSSDYYVNKGLVRQTIALWRNCLHTHI